METTETKQTTAAAADATGKPKKPKPAAAKKALPKTARVLARKAKAKAPVAAKDLTAAQEALRTLVWRAA